MGYLRETDLEGTDSSSIPLREAFGFLPNLFRAQALVPRIHEAVSGLVAALVLRERALARIQKESIMLCVAAAYQNPYCVTLLRHILRSLGLPSDQIDQLVVDHHRAHLSPPDTALLDFVLKLATRGMWLSGEDVAALRERGFEDGYILEAILLTALTHFLCTLSAGLGPSPDFVPFSIPRTMMKPSEFREEHSFLGGTSGPYLATVERGPEAFPSMLLERFRFIPNIFRAQTLRMDLIEAEVDAVRRILQPEEALSQVQKECILLVGSAVNLNTYCVAAHCEVLRLIGVSTEESDQIAFDHHHANLSPADKTLLDFVVKLTARPWETGRKDINALRDAGFSEEQTLEAVAVTGLNNFFNTLQMGLGTAPDIEPVRTFGPGDVHPLVHSNRLSESPGSVDEDLELVARVQGADLDAFEELIARHSRRIYRTILAVVGNTDDAEDAMQEAFLKAFQHIASFQRRSKFSTWLTKIASNTALQRLRERVPTESIDEEPDPDEHFRPRQIRAWDDDPEQLYTRSERRALVESELMKLPVKYRVVLVLRDIEQLSGEEAAATLGIGLPALKSRLLRGRLMLREALAPHFSIGAQRTAL
jgi:RNA polymerase sigma-70 factor (ECF subfamily)